MKGESKLWLNDVTRLLHIARTGLLYPGSDFDRERYEELEAIAFRLLEQTTRHDAETLRAIFPPVADYPTAKVDIRAFVLREDGQLLMVREAADGKWSLPGGWADTGFSPKETVVKEVEEETGISVSVLSLLAILDKRLHPHPPQPFYIYKLFFHCRPHTEVIRKGFDVLDAAYFPLEQLPPLSEDRVLRSQIERMYQKVQQGELFADFD